MDPNADTHGTGGRTGETKVNLLFHKSVIQQKKNKQTKGQETIISPKTKNQSSKENSTRMHEEKGRVPIKTKVQIKQMQKLKIQKTHARGRLEEHGQEHGSRQPQTETDRIQRPDKE